MKGFTHTGRGPMAGHDFSKKVPTVDSFFPGTPNTMSANGSTLHPSAGKPRTPPSAVQHYARGGLIPPDKVAARAAKGKRVGTMKRPMKKAEGGPVSDDDAAALQKVLGTNDEVELTGNGNGATSNYEDQVTASAAPGRGAPMVRDAQGMPMVGARAPASAARRAAAVSAEMANPKAQKALQILHQAEKAGIMPKTGPIAQMSALAKRAVQQPIQRAEGGSVGNALTQRGSPYITEQDRAARGTSPVAPGFRRGGLSQGLGKPVRAGKPGATGQPMRAGKPFGR